MKNLVIVFTMILISSIVMAADVENSNYVLANGQTYFGKNIKFGLRYTKIINTDGEVTRIRNTEVDAISYDNKLFERHPVVLCNKVKPEMAMMEYVTSRSGLKLFRYSSYIETCNEGSGIFRKAHPEYCYFVFKDGEFYLRVDEKNAQTVLPFFGLNN